MYKFLAVFLLVCLSFNLSMGASEHSDPLTDYAQQALRTTLKNRFVTRVVRAEQMGGITPFFLPAALAQSLRDGSIPSVLLLGCGPGASVRAFAPAHVTVVEPNNECLSLGFKPEWTKNAWNNLTKKSGWPNIIGGAKAMGLDTTWATGPNLPSDWINSDVRILPMAVEDLPRALKPFSLIVCENFPTDRKGWGSFFTRVEELLEPEGTFVLQFRDNDYAKLNLVPGFGGSLSCIIEKHFQVHQSIIAPRNNQAALSRDLVPNQDQVRLLVLGKKK